MTDAEFEVKLNAEAHIDELIVIFKDKHTGKPDARDDNDLHGDFAKYGWRYREAYFTDHDGQYYQLNLSLQSVKMAI